MGDKCSYAHRQVDEQPSKKSKKNGDKSAVAMLKITRNLGSVFHDMEPPKSSSILRKSSNMLKPIRCVQFTNAPKFEDRSQEETEWQEGYACEAAWKMARSILKKGEKIKNIILLTFGRIGVYLRHQQLNQRRENLLWTRVRRCT